MKGAHAREVAGRDRRLAGAVGEVAGQLRPVGGGECHVFARDEHPGLTENRARGLDAGVEGLERGLRLALDRIPGLGQHLQRQVVIAHRELIARDLVERLVDRCRLAHREITRVDEPALLAGEELLRGRLLEEREALGQDEREIDSQQPIEEPGCRRGRVVLDTQERPDPGLRRRAVLDRFLSEEHA